MNRLDIEVLFDDIGAGLRKQGKSIDYIRELFSDEGERVAQEIEDSENDGD